jgi:hypothetical protein
MRLRRTCVGVCVCVCVCVCGGGGGGGSLLACLRAREEHSRKIFSGTFLTLCRDYTRARARAKQAMDRSVAHDAPVYFAAESMTKCGERKMMQPSFEFPAKT